MSKLKVTFTQTRTATAIVSADSPKEAEEKAFDLLNHGEIEFADSGVPGDFEVSIEAAAEDDPDTILIYWDDLTGDKQDEILCAFGDNNNYDVIPIAEISIPPREEDA